MFNEAVHRKRLGAAALSLVLFATACGGGATTTDDATTSAPAVDDTTVVTDASASAAGSGLPQLVGDTVAGAQLDTDTLAGQDVVVWFWAPW